MPLSPESNTGALVERMLSLGDISLSVRDSGGDKPAIVLLHGQASSARWWELVAAYLTPRFRVICFDHRGHGQSDRPQYGYTVEGLAGDLQQVITALGTVSPILVGHSLGAAVGLRLAATRPDAAAAVVCVDGGLYDPKEMFGQTWEQAAPRMRYARRGHITPAVLRAWVTGSSMAQESSVDIVTEILLANYEPADAAGELRLRLAATHESSLARSLWECDPLPLLAKVNCPIGVVAAKTGRASDRPRQASIERARALLGGRLLVRWMTGGHDLPVERPSETAAAIAELIERSGGDYGQ